MHPESGAMLWAPRARDHPHLDGGAKAWAPPGTWRNHGDRPAACRILPGLHGVGVLLWGRTDNFMQAARERVLCGRVGSFLLSPGEAPEVIGTVATRPLCTVALLIPTACG